MHIHADMHVLSTHRNVNIYMPTYRQASKQANKHTNKTIQQTSKQASSNNDNTDEPANIVTYISCITYIPYRLARMHVFPPASQPACLLKHVLAYIQASKQANKHTNK